MNPIAFVLLLIAFPVLATIWSMRKGPAGPWRGRFTGGTGILGLGISMSVAGGGNVALNLLIGAAGLALVILALVARDREVAEARKAAKRGG